MNYTLELAENHSCQYQLHNSVRAKYLRIKISPQGEVKLIVPKGVKVQLAHDFIASKKDWVHKCLQQIAQNPPKPIVLPDSLSLRALEEEWLLHYEELDSQKLLLQPGQQSLRMRGNLSHELVFSLLERWLKDKAKTTLPQMLSDTAEQYGFDYNDVTIRGQKTRWGSCSSRRNINLNYKLLFFPEPVVRYVLIHELCHTLEMNHSSRFWDLVERCDVYYQKHRAVLKRAHEFVPHGF